MENVTQEDTQRFLKAMINAISQVTGYSCEEIAKMRPTDFFDAAGAAHIAAAIKVVFEKGSGSVEENLLTKEGRKIPIFFSGSLAQDPAGGPILCGIGKDIGELKRVAPRLEKSEEKFRNLLENFPRGIAIGTPEGHIFEANQAIRALFGYTKEEFQTLPITALYNDPKDRGRLLEEVLNKGGVVDFEALLKRKDGSVFWGSVTTCAQDIDGKTQFLTLVIDITAHKQADVYRAVGLEILKIFNKPGDLKALIQDIVAALKSRTGFDAVGIRLKNEEDFPYLVQSGFSNAFLKTENTLVTRNAGGEVCRNKDGKPCLECICGFVLSGKPVPANPHFTAGGSFWTNDASRLLDLPPDQIPWFHPRNMCIAHGFASIALVPILNKGEAVGLIQINDRRKDCFTLDTIEMLEGVASHIGGVMVRRQVSESLEEEMRNMEILLEVALGREEKIMELKEKIGQLEEELKKRGNSC